MENEEDITLEEDNEDIEEFKHTHVYSPDATCRYCGEYDQVEAEDFTRGYL